MGWKLSTCESNYFFRQRNLTGLEKHSFFVNIRNFDMTSVVTRLHIFSNKVDFEHQNDLSKTWTRWNILVHKPRNCLIWGSHNWNNVMEEWGSKVHGGWNKYDIVAIYLWNSIRKQISPKQNWSREKTQKM